MVVVMGVVFGEVVDYRFVYWGLEADEAADAGFAHCVMCYVCWIVVRWCWME